MKDFWGKNQKTNQQALYNPALFRKIGMNEFDRLENILEISFSRVNISNLFMVNFEDRFMLHYSSF